MDEFPEVDWKGLVPEQLDWHWRAGLRPRMDGLTDAKYWWEPVPGMWSVRPDKEAGTLAIDFAYPPPDPAPVTTIAWRLAHLTVGVFGMRAASHFGGPEVDYQTYEYPCDAVKALAELDAAYGAWMSGLQRLTEEDLRRPIGPAEGPFAEHPMAALVMHINREAIHHGAEIALLRDLYRWQPR